MKSSLLLVFLCLAAAATVNASSKYAGNYYALVYQNGAAAQPEPFLVAAMNITVYNDGVLTGDGGYANLITVSVTGRVKDSGDIILSETINYGAPFKYRTKFSENGKHFSLTLLDGSVLLGRKIPDAFPEAGVYQGFVNNVSVTGLFAVLDDGSVVGFFGDPDHVRVMPVTGTVDGNGFTAASDDGAKIECLFDQGLVGTYTDAMGNENTFDGGKD